MVDKNELRREIADELGYRVVPTDPDSGARALGCFFTVVDADGIKHGAFTLEEWAWESFAGWPESTDKALELFADLPSSFHWRIEYFRDGVPGYRKDEGQYSFQLMEYTTTPASAVAETSALAVCEAWLHWRKMQKEAAKGAGNATIIEGYRNHLLKQLLAQPAGLNALQCNKRVEETLLSLQEEGLVESVVEFSGWWFSLTNKGRQIMKGKDDGN